MLGHLLEVADGIAPPEETLTIHAREDEHPRLRELARRSVSRGVQLVCGPPRADAAVLKTDCYYDAKRLRRVLLRGGSPESAVLWRLDRPETLAVAEEELLRRRTYQPLGKYWAFPLAERLAEWLKPTAVRPNAVTIASAGLMFSAAAIAAGGFSGAIARMSMAFCLAAGLVLDTADGRLARLQGTSSAFGRWLDQVLDELVDMVLHAAIAWAAFCRDGHPGWLLLGTLYASSKYLFQVQSLLGEELESELGRTAATGGSGRLAGDTAGLAVRLREGLAALVHLIGHADLRWHLWIVLALLGRLDLALAGYAGYFALRASGGALRKGVRYA